MRKGNIQGKAFVNISSTANSDGSVTNKTSVGVKAQMPVYKDAKNTISFGTQVKLEHVHKPKTLNTKRVHKIKNIQERDNPLQRACVANSN